MKKESKESFVEKITKVGIEDEMKKAYIDYAMSVIVSRALPSAEDGLKPVQRRILYTMYQMNLLHNKPTKKTARIVGECMGKYHPHGDAAIYDSLVRMAQPFSFRYCLVEGQGNFGSIDGDPPAAMRYTEARLTALAEEMLQDIEKNTVPMQPNFDNSLKEPVILPAKLPNLLINGSQGIAVGMATTIPPHNLTEVIDGIIAYIKNPNITVRQLMNHIKGPDFPTYGYVCKEDLTELYEKGKGSLTLRGKAYVETLKKGKEAIIISEIPYQVNKAELIKEIAKLVQEKKIEDVSAIRDESAKDKIRIVLILRKNANPELIINKLFKLTQLETKMHCTILALVNGIPKILNLKELISCYVSHRKEVVRKRTQFELEVAQNKEHILLGLTTALKNLDKVIKIIKKSKTAKEAITTLTKELNLSVRQAQAILDMKLQRLTAIEQEKVRKELKQIKEKISELKKILGSEKEILNVIKKELEELKRKYGDKRRTKLIEKPVEMEEKDLIKKETITVILTVKGYIKRMPAKLYKEQHRGGTGISCAELTADDFVQKTFECSTHDAILFVTERGKLYQLDAYKIPEASRYSKGKAIVNLLKINEKIKAVIPLTSLNGSLLIVTKKGIAKRISLDEFSKIKKSGIKVVKLPLDDSVVDAEIASEDDEIVIATKKGMAVRFDAKEVREMKKAAYGVRAIKLSKDDSVIGLVVLGKNKEGSILTITEKGYGKRSRLNDYRKTARACKGIINMKCSERNGNAVGIALVDENDSIIVTTKKGMLIKVPCKDIRIMSRNTQGVRIIKLKKDDAVASVSKVSNATETEKK
ncbi:DNA gyrase subunit A [Candidatus Pacearchaeota archaeon ex4484_31]|nr:MAG: DNA gyrase subunit A [Candidatus Pacearchaeota archaeon ex4484_31]